MSEWISVKDRVPESGKDVLLHVTGKDIYTYQYICVGFYAAKNSIVDDSGDGVASEYDEQTDKYYLIAGWYEAIHNWDDYSSIYIEDRVTHWMPLPKPPSHMGGK